MRLYVEPGFLESITSRHLRYPCEGSVVAVASKQAEWHAFLLVKARSACPQPTQARTAVLPAPALVEWAAEEVFGKRDAPMAVLHYDDANAAGLDRERPCSHPTSIQQASPRLPGASPCAGAAWAMESDNKSGTPMMLFIRATPAMELAR